MELLLYALCVIPLACSLYLLRRFLDARRNLPPGPRRLPLVGNLLELGDLPHRSLARLAERHGPLMTLRLGAVTTVVASSPDAARDILQRHDVAFSTRSVPDIVRACGHDRFASPSPASRPAAPSGVPSAGCAPRSSSRPAAAPPRRAADPPPREGPSARVARREGGPRGRARRRPPRRLHDLAERALVHPVLRRPRGP
uniref:Cytochrome P450 n=1 Tax=Oryza brachyantha TaxID=4533 RepID=J3LM01_ORYBR